ncbi:MAG: T9SS type A sorting domain-containing protein [Brumimicrobium sp.]|nr:T9SS type A sorting domain-containing protein [Brumimicrobium sp.]
MKQFIKNIGKIALSISCFGLLSTTTVAQTGNPGNNLWTFPPNQFDQVNLSIAPLPQGPDIGDYDGAPSQNSHNIIRDMDGNIRFFVVDNRVFDSEGRLINVMQNLSTEVKGGAETLIVPDPNNCQRYYIFAIGRTDYTTLSNKVPFYSILDFSLPNANPLVEGDLLIGSFGSTSFNIVDMTPNFYESFGALRQGNVFFASSEKRCDNSYLIYISTEEGIHKYILDDNGFNYDNHYIEYSLAVPNSEMLTRSGMSLRELSNGNFRIAVAHQAFGPNQGDNAGIGVFTAQLDNNGNLISSSEQTMFLEDDCLPSCYNSRAFVHGLEFSPGGNILYVTHHTNSNHPNPLEYFDFDNPGSGDLQPLNVQNANEFKMSQMEIDIDGDLVLVTEERIAALGNPNTPDPNYWNPAKIQFVNDYLPNDESHQSTTIAEFRGLSSYIFPQQVAGMDYTEHLTSNLACLGITDNNINQVWSPGVSNNPFGSSNGDVYIDGDLIIPAGSYIQIKDMNFYFTPGSKLIVERGNGSLRGARLTLIRNTTLTVDTECFIDAMWNGVQVQGYSNLNQDLSTSGKQGWFRMYNNSKIEHAYIGVATTIYSSQSAYPYRPGLGQSGSTGGIIEISNSTFHNNERDILLSGYIAPNGLDNRFSVTNTEFNTDGVLNDPSAYPIAHVTTFNNVGVKLFGNDYINYTPDLYSFNRQGIGVLSFNSQIKIKARCAGLVPVGTPCTNFDQSFFRDLTFGVYSFSSITGRKTTVDRSIFKNNYFGILLGNIDYAEVTRNEFEVYRSAAPNETFATYGVYLYSCDGYQVEENNFTEYNDPIVTSSGNSHGVIVNNSGFGDNEIYRNDFANIKIGGQSQNINSEPYDFSSPYPNNTGLRWKCNDFSQDIYEADLAVASGRIAYQQGFCTSPNFDLIEAVQSPAGNRFSHSTFTTQNDIAVNDDPNLNPQILPFEYSHHADNITTPLYFNTDFVTTSSCFNTANQVNYDETNSCPSEITDLSGTTGVLPFLNLFKSRLDSLKEVISSKEALIDDNRTQELLSIIQTEDDGVVKNTLLAVSPYLSDEVLIAYINSNPPSGHLNQVIQANSPLSAAVLAALDNINIPNGIANQINSVQGGESERDYLITSINYDKTERSLMLDKIIRLVLEDTIMPGRLDTVAVLLKYESEQRRKEHLCDVYLCNRDTVKFEDTRSNLETEFGLTNFIRIAGMNDIISKGTGVYCTDTLRINSNLRQEVEDVAYDPNDRINAVHGEALLSALGDSLYYPIVEPLFVNTGNKMMANENDKLSSQILTEMKLYPNPSKGSIVNVEIDGEVYSNPKVEVIDLTGKRVADYSFDKNKVKISTSNLKAGIYFVKLNDEGRYIETQKLIVQ